MKRTYQPHKGRRLKRQGFLNRSKSKKSRKVINRRIAKGRKKITISASK